MKSKNLLIILISVLLCVIIGLVAFIVIDKSNGGKTDDSGTSISQENSETEPSDVEKPEEEPKVNDEWKSAYLSYIESQKENGFVEYALVYIDNDNIPELYLMGDSEATGEQLCTYKNGNVISENMGRLYGISYVEKSGKILCSNGHMGYYYDYLYTLKDGEFKLEKECTYEEDFESTEVTFIYKINGKTVDEQTYNDTVDAWLNKNEAKSPNDSAKTYDGIINELSSNGAENANEFVIPKELRNLIGTPKTELIKNGVQHDGYYNGGKYYILPENGYWVIFDDYKNDNPVVETIIADLDALIPGKYVCSYTELKAIIGDSLGEFFQSEMDGSYMCIADIGEYSILFNSTDSKFTGFQITKQN